MEIAELSKQPNFIDDAIQYFWKHWGNESNQIFYKDCILNSLSKENALPKFYIVLKDQKIIASYALITNDIVSRQDLMPWFACLYVNEEHRNNGLGGKLLDHALAEAKSKGFKNVYLSTDLENFYERKGWTYKCEGYGVFGDPFKIYEKVC